VAGIRRPQGSFNHRQSVDKFMQAESGFDFVPKMHAFPAGVIQAVVMHALQLRPSSREVFVLCDIQGFSVAEAATLLGVSPEVANTRLKRARRQMGDVVSRLCDQDSGARERALPAEGSSL
jgi:DNA-directed RNA polymerase specialized sigma24 family protein